MKRHLVAMQSCENTFEYRRLHGCSLNYNHIAVIGGIQVRASFFLFFCFLACDDMFSVISFSWNSCYCGWRLYLCLLASTCACISATFRFNRLRLLNFSCAAAQAPRCRYHNDFGLPTALVTRLAAAPTAQSPAKLFARYTLTRAAAKNGKKCLYRT